MKKLIIYTDDTLIDIKVEDNVQKKIKIKKGIVHFGDIIGVSINKLIAYEFTKVKKNE